MKQKAEIERQTPKNSRPFQHFSIWSCSRIPCHSCLSWFPHPDPCQSVKSVSEILVHFLLNKLSPSAITLPVIVGIHEKMPSSSAPDRPPGVQLSPLETEIIDLFVQLSRLFGQPRSLAEIYGLLFISSVPLTMDDLIARLRLSKGSASQGLKFLRNMGAVQTVYVAGDRRVYYEAVAELRNLATRFLRDQIVPHLDNGQARLDRISGLVKEMPTDQRSRVATRVTMLQSWVRNGRRFLPLVVRILGNGK